MFTYCELISSLISLCSHHSSFLHHPHYPMVQTYVLFFSYFIVQTIYIYSRDRKQGLVYLILININLEVSISDVIYICIYHNLVTEMQAAVVIISVSRSIHHKLSFHCHVMYIFPKYFHVCMYIFPK